ncbi:MULTISPECIES: 2-dehydro-3-deoxygalactonokinase [Sphingobium]|uniref:2-dehydro-3-deoxygalactonokinase n=1 Tax=Sphingobium indicum (strain DSM 16413 / CCM 7287 / MTCC 6362 / UT26 / NBRC 101211 / UT26S) TaxID=452662 RepID=D4YYK1_SPHIU|nr:2-dehydro-3-deoxygalactonokinase [Sphingobium indicum]BAI95433.1 2-dehydro-3-deoxygalactonokinase [Sphingobium indicum UT26S]
MNLMSRYEVVGDWGTSRLRLFRVEQGRVTARHDGPGIGAAAGQAEAAFAAAIGPWLEEAAPTQIRLCGMAGARDGWVEAPYADCPADAATWRAAATRFAWRGVPVAIMAGLACTGANGAPDVMRGEETQIFGAMARDPALGQGRSLIVLPGTHNKWAVVQDGRVSSFRTMPTGELFALLRDRSTLGAQADRPDPAREAQGFAEGLARAQEGRPLSSLFAARTMRLRAGRPAEWAAGYLSGLLIGTEIAEVADMLEQADDIWLIGDGRLSTLYAEALGRRGLVAQALDGDACSLAGLGLSGHPHHPHGDPS